MGCKKNMILKILAIIIFSLQFFYSSCQRSSSKKLSYEKSQIQLSKNDRRWMEKFFCDITFDELKSSIIYTIFGSKPLSSKTITTATKEEWLDSIRPYIKNYSLEEQKKILDHLSDYIKGYNIPGNLNRWILWKKKYPNRSILFRETSSIDGKMFELYVLNVEEALKILQKHYNSFKKTVGTNFIPEEMISNFENLDSPFWKKVLKDHYLVGLLYGFGEHNALLFSENNKTKNHGKLSSSFDSKDADTSSLNRLALPPFVSYTTLSGDDPIIQKFKSERKQIQKKLKNKDFLEEVLYQVLKESKIHKNQKTSD
jgi:uncharacterized protein (UPF0297 family)